MPYTVLPNSKWVSFHDAINAKASPINHADYSCHIAAFELA